MIQKSFSCKNKHYIVIVPVPNFDLSAWSSLFIIFFHIYGEPFKKHPVSARKSYRKRHCCSILSQDGYPAVFIWMPPRHSDSGHLENWTKIFHHPTSTGASERTNEWAQRSARAKRAVHSKRMSERCERTRERMSEWPYTNIPISRHSRELWEWLSFATYSMFLASFVMK